MVFLHPLFPETGGFTPPAKSDVSKNGDNGKGAETLLSILNEEAQSELPKEVNESSARVKSVASKSGGKDIGRMSLQRVGGDEVCCVVIYINLIFIATYSI